MKNIKIFSSIILFTVMIAVNAKDSKVKETSFKVYGVCNECKARIENAALIKGVKKAEWDKNKNLLQIVYDTTKTDLTLIHKSVAKAGHDTEKEMATKEAYEKLPKCCQYRDGVKAH